MNKQNVLFGLGIVLIVAAVLASAFGGYMAWQIDQDTGAYLDRAVQSSNAEDMKYYLNAALTGMERWGYTDGHYVLIFHTPQNNATHDYRAATRMVERLDRIEHKDQDSTEYQVAMDDIRGTIRDSEWKPYQHWAIHGTPFAFMYWFPVVGGAIGARLVFIGVMWNVFH